MSIFVFIFHQISYSHPQIRVPHNGSVRESEGSGVYPLGRGGHAARVVRRHRAGRRRRRHGDRLAQPQGGQWVN